MDQCFYLLYLVRLIEWTQKWYVFYFLLFEDGEIRSGQHVLGSLSLYSSPLLASRYKATGRISILTHLILHSDPIAVKVIINLSLIILLYNKQLPQEYMRIRAVAIRFLHFCLGLLRCKRVWVKPPVTLIMKFIYVDSYEFSNLRALCLHRIRKTHLELPSDISVFWKSGLEDIRR